MTPTRPCAPPDPLAASPASPRPRARQALACAALLVLAACGGGDLPDAGATLADEPGAHNGLADGGEPDAGTAGRQFLLWTPGDEAALQLEQQQLDPDADGSSVRLLVKLNPAAVFADGRATMLAVPGNGESADSAALRAGQLAAKAQAVDSAAKGVLARSVMRVAPGAKLHQQFAHAVEAFVLSVPWDQAAALAAELARDPAIDAVEVDRARGLGQTADAPRSFDPRAWGVDRIDQRARALDGSFRQSLSGAGVSIFVLDTGISPHVEFGTRLAAGFSAINDGRGTGDCHGHGTHVAATAGGARVGVASGARLVPVRVMGCTGSSLGSSVLAGLDWVAAHGSRPGVVNLSLGGAASATLDAAAQRLVTAGLSVVTAAGNSNADACNQSPGRAAGVVNVAASDTADAKASFSNWGRCVTLWAPGTAIVSASRSSTTALAAMNGTSMAAPHAAGALALLLQAGPTLAPEALRQQLLAQATPDTVSGTPAGSPRGLLFVGQDTALPPVVPPPTMTVAGIRMVSSVPAVGAWRVATELRLLKDDGQPAAGAKLTGRFSNTTALATCTTSAKGLCSFVGPDLKWATVPVLGFAVVDVKAAGMVYTGGGERQAQISRPAAPEARIAALSGVVSRSRPAAPDWVPQFQVTVRDERGAAVVGAVVKTGVSIHAGRQVVGQRTLSCTTAATGQCALGWSGARLDQRHSGAQLQVLGVTRDFLSYRPGALSSATVGVVQ
jgi:subtilisin family serine protease